MWHILHRRMPVPWYATRWMIEEYHKAIKTGLGAERLQPESAERLFAAIAIMSVVALRLLELRERLRRHPDAAAEQAGLHPLELEVLRVKSGRQLYTVREVALAIGRLGGHLNRKSDGLPGWQTLWHGMNTLHALVEGVLIAYRLKTFWVMTSTKPWCGEVVKQTGVQTYFSWQCFHAQPGGASWTPGRHSAPTGTALPEAKSAGAISVSIRRRSSASSATRVIKSSAPAKGPSSIACAPRQRPWCSW